MGGGFKDSHHYPLAHSLCVSQPHGCVWRYMLSVTAPPPCLSDYYQALCHDGDTVGPILIGDLDLNK